MVPAEKRLKAFGLLYWAINLGFAAGTSLAGFVAKSGFAILFVGDAATTLLFAALVWRFVPETRPAPGDHPHGGLMAPFVDRVYLPFLLVSFVVAGVFFQHLVALPATMVKQGLDTSDFGRAIAVNGVLIVVLQPFTTRWFARVRRARVLAAASVLVGLGMWMHGQVSTLSGHLLAVSVWTLGEILMAPVNSTIVADLSPTHLRGRYQGAFSLTWSLAVTVASLWGPWVAEAWSMSALWAVCLALGLGTAGVQLWLGPQRRQRLVLSSASGLVD